MPSPSTTKVMQEEIQIAMKLSSLGMTKNNITAAQEACQKWEQILFAQQQGGRNNNIAAGDVIVNDDDTSSIRILCYALYVSCLVRTGRDDKAISVCDLALLQHDDDGTNLKPKEGTNQMKELLLGKKANAHQRLLQYEEAKETFLLLLLSHQLNSPKKNNNNDKDYYSYTMGAANCCLRLNRPKEARSILTRYCHDQNPSPPPSNNPSRHESDDDSITEDPSVNLLVHAKALVAVLNYTLNIDPHKEGKSTTNTSSIAVSDEILSDIKAAARTSLLYQWIYDSILSSDEDPLVFSPHLDDDDVHYGDSVFMQLLKINLFPLDDPALIWLDDKIHLHRLLSGTTNDSTSVGWPDGMILSEEEISRLLLLQQQQQALAHQDQVPSLWMLKHRAGYGSHGNKIVTLFFNEQQQQALHTISSDQQQQQQQKDQPAEEMLLQRLVDPTLLIDGRKFSLRIYVVYFSPNDVYLSSQGLVKIAATEATPTTESLANGDFEDRAYMTNSGREATMMQHDLDYFRTGSNLFVNDGGDGDDGNDDQYDKFWSKIRDSVKGLMSSFRNNIPAEYWGDSSSSSSSNWNTRRESLCIPKILGLDYVVDVNYNPWLLEVNRFPGLEPRDAIHDRNVKYQIVRDAWICANEKKKKKKKQRVVGRRKLPLLDPFLSTMFGDTFPAVTDECPYSLEKLV
eukprot:scaffold3136_cov102-Cylindrotheca_fusiformis.AAC.12